MSSGSVASQQSLSAVSKSSPKKRHRCYPESSKGPFEVFVRQKDKPVKVLLVSAEVHKHFRSVKEVKQIGFSKVRLLFSDRTEANNVVYNELLSRLYRVYIPSEQVEIDGVINHAEMDMDHLMKNGFGKFNDPRVPLVSILECQQLAEARVEGDVKTYSPSNQIRVTFEGKILPQYVVIDQALIRVRIYSPKVMLCSKCKKFGHTEFYCSNQARCGKCGNRHNEGECSVQQPACLYCKGTHVFKNECPIYKKHMALAKARVVQKSKLSYAETVKASASQSFESENMYSSLSEMSDSDEEESHYSSYVFPKRKKLRSVRNSKRSKTNIENVSLSADQVPRRTKPLNEIPGFKKVDFPPLPGGSRRSQEPVNSGREPERSGENSSLFTDKLTLSQLIKLFAEAFDLGKNWVDFLLKLTPIFKTILAKIITSLPLLASFLTIDG